MSFDEDVGPNHEIMSIKKQFHENTDNRLKSFTSQSLKFVHKCMPDTNLTQTQLINKMESDKKLGYHHNYVNIIMQSDYINQRQYELNKKIVYLSKLLNLESKRNVINSHTQDQATIINFKPGFEEEQLLMLTDYHKKLLQKAKTLEKLV